MKIAFKLSFIESLLNQRNINYMDGENFHVFNGYWKFCQIVLVPQKPYTDRMVKSVMYLVVSKGYWKFVKNCHTRSSKNIYRVDGDQFHVFMLRLLKTCQILVDQQKIYLHRLDGEKFHEFKGFSKLIKLL